MNNIQNTFFGCIVGLASIAPLGANAFPINNSTPDGTTFTVSFALEDGATDPNGNTNNSGQDITGEAVFELLSTDTVDNVDTVIFNLTLSNTTAVNDDEIGLQAFGFATDPDALVDWKQLDGGDSDPGKVTDVGDFEEFNYNELDNAISPGAATVIEIITDTGNGANKTLQAGESDLFELTLTFDPSALNGDISIEPFAVKFQSDPVSFQMGGHDGGGDDPGVEPGPGVPAPGTLALLAIGALGARRMTSKR